jgi:multiple sugar transport system ATP-binding protein
MADVRYVQATKLYAGSDLPAVDALDLEIADGELMVLVGPSGSGKTTALRMLAGLEEVDAGAVLIGDRDVTDLPPKKRDIAMVFQNYALYPYLTVSQNIAFPLKMAGVKKAEREAKAAEVAGRLGLERLLDRKPSQLSGGERQRVAMGRAIIRFPSVFLMDEPLSNLDAKLRVQMRADVAALQHDLGTTTVYVTHDQSEAMTLGHRVAVLDHGLLQQVGTPRELYDQPANRFVAGFIGSPAMNLCELPLGSNGAVSFGRERVELGEKLTAAAQANGRSEVVIGLRPEALELGAEGIPADVEVVEEFGADAYVFCVARLREGAGGTTRLVARTEARSAPDRGERIALRVRPGEAHVFDAETGVRLGPG